jgi:hypothetical protein
MNKLTKKNKKTQNNFDTKYKSKLLGHLINTKILTIMLDPIKIHEDDKNYIYL